MVILRTAYYGAYGITVWTAHGSALYAFMGTDPHGNARDDTLGYTQWYSTTVYCTRWFMKLYTMFTTRSNNVQVNCLVYTRFWKINYYRQVPTAHVAILRTVCTVITPVGPLNSKYWQIINTILAHIHQIHRNIRQFSKSVGIYFARRLARTFASYATVYCWYRYLFCA